MGTDFTFAYGSNMNSSDLRSWLERNGYNSALIVNRWLGVLEGYDFVWNYFSRARGGGAANLERKENSHVIGLLIEFERPLLKAFDRKEGHPLFYSRGEKRVPVRRLDDNETVEAWLYLAKPNRGDMRDILPSRAYKKIIVDAVQEFGLPEDYIEKIMAWPTQD
jgi:gamma-glutamylcyclotransferase (GGCT)/AIG2-like uncharacterized protein YtfP